MDLFVLTNDPSVRILKVILTKDAENELDALFKKMEEDFRGCSTSAVPFDGNYKPEDDEVLEIANYNDIDGVLDAVANPEKIGDFKPDTNLFYKIKALFSGKRESDGKLTAFIQKFDKRRLINSGFSIFYSKNTFERFTGSGLTFDNKLTAILCGNNLRFRSFYLVKQVFDMEDYYKEATEEDLVAFANYENVTVKNVDEFVSQSKGWIRRKVASIQRARILELVPIKIIKAVADQFDIELEIKDSKIVFPSDLTKLKEILRLLDEDYYKSPLSDGLWLANSKRIVD